MTDKRVGIEFVDNGPLIRLVLGLSFWLTALEHECTSAETWQRPSMGKVSIPGQFHVKKTRELHKTHLRMQMINFPKTSASDSLMGWETKNKAIMF